MYYDDLLEILNKEKRVIDGQELKGIFLKKYGSGNVINMNKALRKLRENEEVCFKIDGRKIFYWSLSIRKSVDFAKFLKEFKKEKSAINI